MIIDAGIWDIRALNRILTECKVYARSDPADADWLIFPAEQEHVIHAVIDLLAAAATAKARRRLPWWQPGIGVSRN